MTFPDNAARFPGYFGCPSPASGRGETMYALKRKML